MGRSSGERRTDTIRDVVLETSQEGLPAYDDHEATSSDKRRMVDVPSGRDGVYRDRPEISRASALSYGSHNTGPSERGAFGPRADIPLFASRSSRAGASSSLSALYKDVIERPSSSTKDIFSTLCETCTKGSLSLSSITPSVEGRRPVFWMIVHKKHMPGTIDVFLAQTSRYTRLTLQDINQGQAASLVVDSCEIYRQLEASREMLGPREQRKYYPDTFEIMKTDQPVLGFIANITIKDFATRYRVKGDLALSFPARHREWSLHLGPTRVPLHLLRHNQLFGPRMVAELFLASGDALACTARLRLRHPKHTYESDWLNLGSLQVVSNVMRESLPTNVKFNGFSCPVLLSQNRDWQALELGETNFISAAGDLNLQLQVVAEEVRNTQAGDCCIQ